jgi:poly(3-hydroxybutyrate) depolymerase
MSRTWLHYLLCGALMVGCSRDKADPDGSDETAEQPDDEDDEGASAPKDAGRRDASAQRDGSAPEEEPEQDAQAEGKPDASTAAPDSGRTQNDEGPADGDPNAPVVAIPDVKCGGPGASAGGSLNPLGSANLKVGGRDVILTYPCDKHEGAKVVFILNLHGTMPTENIKFYQHGYFAAHALTNSHNVIVATPKSRASQWGNTGENPAASEDRQHLLDVIEYVYTNLGKFDITGLWVGGHSWGSMYAKRFVCEEAIKDRAHGVIGMSGGATAPGGRAFGASDLKLTTNCQDYISQIHTVGDTDSVTGLPDQTAPATKHGCAAKTAPTDLGKMQMSEQWPDCDPGWVHENITMGAHSHTTSINPEVVKHIVEQIKKAEAR